MARLKLYPVTKVCDGCGKLFSAKPRANRPSRFCSRACCDSRSGEDRPNYNGGRANSYNGGYPSIRCEGHPRANSAGFVHEHILVAERALGRRLPQGAVVHHVNENKSDPSNSNLVICQDANYHLHLHARMRIKAAGGNPNTDAICGKCGAVKNRTEFHSNAGNTHGVHSRCKQCRKGRP